MAITAKTFEVDPWFSTAAGGIRYMTNNEDIQYLESLTLPAESRISKKPKKGKHHFMSVGVTHINMAHGMRMLYIYNYIYIFNYVYYNYIYKIILYYIYIYIYVETCRFVPDASHRLFQVICLISSNNIHHLGQGANQRIQEVNLLMADEFGHDRCSKAGLFDDMTNVLGHPWTGRSYEHLVY